MNNNAAFGRGAATGSDAPAWRRFGRTNPRCRNANNARRSARDRRSVPPNRRLPTVPRRRYYSHSKFIRSESAGVARSGRPRMTIKGELHGTKRSASGGEPAQVPGGRRGGGCRHCGHAPGSERRDAGDLAECGPAAAAIGAPAQYARGGGRDRNAEGAAADRRRRRLGLHGRRDQDARHQILPLELCLQLPRHPRVADQLRRQQDAGIPHLHARGIRGRHGARLLQDRRQAADDAVPRHRRPAARHDGASTMPGATGCR